MRPAGKREAAGGGRAKSKRGERACFYRFVCFPPSRLSLLHNRAVYPLLRLVLTLIGSRLAVVPLSSRPCASSPRLVMPSRLVISLSRFLFAIASVFDDAVSPLFLLVVSFACLLRRLILSVSFYLFSLLSSRPGVSYSFSSHMIVSYSLAPFAGCLPRCVSLSHFVVFCSYCLSLSSRHHYLSPVASHTLPSYVCSSRPSSTGPI